MKLLLLPGFLGRASDFEAWTQELRTALLADGKPWFTSIKTIAVCEGREALSSPDWSSWIRFQIDQLETWKGSEDVCAIGYSLGGRLLLSLTRERPDLFQKLIFMSVNPGLSSETELRAREASDEAWAQRFESETWASLLEEWNKQGVFQGSVQEPERLESDYSRETLAHVLRVFSLSKQSDARGWLAHLTTPQLWLAGERDAKFCSMLSEVQTLAPNAIQTQKITEASHRVFLDQPAQTSRAISNFL